MKSQIILLGFFVLTVASCKNSRTEEKPKPETPKALEDKSASREIISKRGDDDLVESLYKELADKTPELKELESRIENLPESKSDSTKGFDNYSRKNRSFYSSAENHIEQINDSVLRDKMKLLIANSVAKYKSSISRQSDLLKSIEAKELTLGDLHTILKITRTLPLIGQYQKENLPAIKPLEGFQKQLDETINFADTLIKK